MSTRKWARLRKAVAMGARHQEAVSGSRRWRALVHEAHRRADLALGKRLARQQLAAFQKLREQATIARMEQDL